MSSLGINVLFIYASLTYLCSIFTNSKDKIKKKRLVRKCTISCFGVNQYIILSHQPPEDHWATFFTNIEIFK